MRKILATMLAAVIAALAAAKLPEELFGNDGEREQPSGPSLPAVVREAANTITSDRLRERLFFIASDTFGERHTPSNGLDRAAQYISNALRDARLAFAPNLRDFFQTIPYSLFVIDSAGSRLRIGPSEFTYGVDFKVGGLSAANGFGSSAGPVVYVGHGLIIPSQNIDPYRGIDVRGKIILAHTEWPRGVPASGWIYPTAYANTHGARGVLLLATYRHLVEWNQRTDPSVLGLVGVGDVIQSDNVGRVPTLTIGPSALAVLMRGEKYSAAELFARGLMGDPPAPFVLDSTKQVAMTTAYRFESLGHDPRNVVAVLEGSDPVLRREYVVLGAHYDADVEDPPEGTDSVHNGADDNASGTVALLEIARAMSRAPRPRRSVVFAWFAGEDTGRWGSRYFVRRPPIPLDRVAAYMNVDMIGRSRAGNDTSSQLTGPNEVKVKGRASHAGFSDLAAAVNRNYLRLTFRSAPSDSGSGDSQPFSRRGIPVLDFSTGLHGDYHEVTDSPDKVDYRKLETIARTIFAIAWSTAQGFESRRATP